MGTNRNILTRIGGLLLLLMACVMGGCSVTSHLPEGQLLYTGVSGIERYPSDTVDALVDEAMALTLEVPPTNAFLGSAYKMSLFPIGLWAYNALYTEQEHGLRYWLWSTLKSEPKLVSQVNPRLRAQAAEALLKDEGYFDAIVTFDTIFNKKDSLQAKLAYDVTFHHQSRLGSIRMMPSSSVCVDSILSRTRKQSLLHPGDRFSASRLEEEQNRISATMRDSGYFFFSPDYVKYLGDSTLARNTVSLRVLPDINGDVKALRPCVIDSVFYHLDFGYGMSLQNYERHGFMTIGYNGQQTVRTKYLERALGFRRGALYNPGLTERAKANLSRLNAFQYTTTEFQVLNPELSVESADPALDTLRLMLKIHAVNSMPWSGGTEVGVVYKDNRQVGPGITFNAQRRNLFGGGETLSGELTGSYEWSTGMRRSDNKLVNSFEFGTKVVYSTPRLPLQRLWHVDANSPVSSHYSLSVDWSRRGDLFEMVKSSASFDYSYSRGECHTFTFTPLRLTYVRTLSHTTRFDSIVSAYPALQRSLENQFIPQMQFSWIYDNSALRQGRSSHQYLRLSLSEAGGLLDVLTGLLGTHRKQGERQLLDQQFSQFVKVTSEFINTCQLSPRSSLVTRILAGAGYAYGNSNTMPYSEQFYIGGSNSLRGFAVRSIGPGTQWMPRSRTNMGNSLNCMGDYKFEANLECRFPIWSSLNGALFTDAGNIWKFDSEVTFDDETLQGNLFEELAVDCGAGLRLDLGMLVVRFDVGVPLHDPNSYGSYFNCCDGFFKNLAYNLAVGYPF